MGALGERLGFSRRLVNRAPLSWTLPAVAIAAVANVPLVYLFVRAAGRGWAGYWDELWRPSTLELIARSVQLVAGVVALTAVLAVPLAWLVSRTDLPGRRLWAVTLALPLVFPSYVAALAMVTLLGPRGLVQQWLAPWGVERLAGFAYGYPGALLALALFVYPYTYLMIVAALRGSDPRLEESSRSLGHGRWSTFFRVVLPQLRPALYGGSLLVALYTLSDFGAVSIVRFDTFTLSIYNAYRALFDRTAAAALATLLVFLTLILVGAEAWLSRRYRGRAAGSAAPPRPIALGRWRWPSLLFVLIVQLVSLVGPGAVLLIWGSRAVAAGSSLLPAASAALRSLGVATGAALAAVVFSLPLVVWAVRRPGPVALTVERLSYSGHALPGLVVALSLVFLTVRHLPMVYQTLPLLVAAYVIRFLPEAARSVRSSLMAVSTVYEEAARSLGRSANGVLRSITLPMMRPGLLVGGGLVFVTTMKELPATLILRPIGFDTLASRIWTAASEGIYSEASLPALVLLGVTAVPVYLLVIRPGLR